MDQKTNTVASILFMVTGMATVGVIDNFITYIACGSKPVAISLPTQHDRRSGHCGFRPYGWLDIAPFKAMACLGP
jgi:hypothetical protein